MSYPNPVRVGDRVAIRFAGLDGPTEAVGVLTALDGGTWTILPDGAPPLTVQRSAVTAARVVPARVVRPRSPIEDVELLAAAGWPGTDRERLGGWLLRAAYGASGRANSCLPTGDPGCSATAAVERVREWYGERGLVPRFQLPEALGPRYPTFRRPPEDLLARLRTERWTSESATLMLVGDVRRLTRCTTTESWRCGWSDTPDDAWWGLDGAVPVRRAEALAAPARYLLVREREDQVVAAGRLAVLRDWCGLSNITVAPGLRRRGHGRRTVAAMLTEGSRLGAKFAYVQVQESNCAALALYESLGFARHHRYAYWIPADQG